MNITVFGASGAIGRLLVGVALAHGHRVTACVRRPGSLIAGGSLQVLIGELSGQVMMEAAIAGADVVMSALGPALDMSRKAKGCPIAEGHAWMIQAMERLGKKRLITLGTPSIRAREDRRQLWTVAPAVMARLLYPNPYRDIVQVGQLVSASSLDWTVVRIINPNARHNDRGYRVSLGDTPVKMAVSRENVANFMYDVAEGNLYVRQMPIVFNA